MLNYSIREKELNNLGSRNQLQGIRNKSFTFDDDILVPEDNEPGPSSAFALIINGHSLVHALNARMERLFLDVATRSQAVYDPFFISCFNLFYTSMPVLALAVLEQDVNDVYSMRYPKLYTPGLKGLLFNKVEFFKSVLMGVITSAALFFVTWGTYQDALNPEGQVTSDLMLFGSVLATNLVMVVTLQIALDTAHWTIINFLTLAASLLLYFTLTFSYYYIFSSQYLGSLKKAMEAANFWFTLILLMAVLILPIVAKRFYMHDLYPTLSDRVRLKQRQASKTSHQQPQKDFQRVNSAFGRSRRSLRSGYAFSHQEGFGRLITTGKMMRPAANVNGMYTKYYNRVTSGSGAIIGADAPLPPAGPSVLNQRSAPLVTFVTPNSVLPTYGASGQTLSYLELATLLRLCWAQTISSKAKMFPTLRLWFLSISAGVFAENGRFKDISDDPYVFSVKDLPENTRFLPTLGNGHLATVVNTDVIYVNGLYNGARGDSHRAKVASLHRAQVELVGAGELIDITFSLDTRRGVFEEVREYSDCSFTQTQLAHQFYSTSLVNVLKVTSKTDETLDLVLRLETTPQPSETDDLNLFSMTTLPDGTVILCYKTKVVEDPRYQQEGSEICITSDSTIPTGQDVNIQLSPENNTFFVAQYSLYGSNLHQELGLTISDMKLMQPEELMDSHVAAWTERFNNFVISVKGDLEMAKVVQGSIYYLMSSTPSHNEFVASERFFGLSPGSLAYGDRMMDYQGHSFWDTETWMFPAFLLFDPLAAKETLNYRVANLAAARDRALETGYLLARFPWESGFTGSEVTPDCCPDVRDNEQHITADIALAAKQYIDLTQDLEWLTSPQTSTQETGCDLLLDIGNFWLSRVQQLDHPPGSYGILGVMPPDEDHSLVNNSVYTNVAAASALRTAKYAACLCDAETSDGFLESLSEVADNMWVPFDSELGYHPEFDGYEIGEAIKQADAILLGYPLGLEMDSAVRRKDLEIYEAAVRPTGPAMTWSMHAVGWAELGEWDRAETMFNKSYQLYVREPFRIWTEAQDGLGAINFITGMGGFLQAILFGYAGIRIQTDRLYFNPHLPPGVTELELRGVAYRGSRSSITIGSNGIIFQAKELSESKTLFLQQSDMVFIVDDFNLRVGPLGPQQPPAPGRPQGQLPNNNMVPSAQQHQQPGIVNPGGYSGKMVLPGTPPGHSQQFQVLLNPQEEIPVMKPAQRQPEVPKKHLRKSFLPESDL
ncbi:unnamed protein product [Notodromas monacha]|uniref:Protein-glucosylgalactosylhydroxylysine glucosidase n=2 Tax=Notodromas monacha TaxID=399045 RepID=A0A7R9GH51_9CRUS|nr:unnamed protein product [Notodromas monacha]CAG0920549.1 unnamed protein product [Notodromas monacha]